MDEYVEGLIKEFMLKYVDGYDVSYIQAEHALRSLITKVILHIQEEDKVEDEW